MINVIGELRVEIAQRIVGKSGQMNDRVETPEIRFRQVAQILADFRNRLGRRSKVAPAVKIGIDPDHFVTSRLQYRPRDGADVTLMTCKQNFHMTPWLDASRLCSLGIAPAIPSKRLKIPVCDCPSCKCPVASVLMTYKQPHSGP